MVDWMLLAKGQDVINQHYQSIVEKTQALPSCVFVLMCRDSNTNLRILQCWNVPDRRDAVKKKKKEALTKMLCQREKEVNYICCK